MAESIVFSDSHFILTTYATGGGLWISFIYLVKSRYHGSQIPSDEKCSFMNKVSYVMYVISQPVSSASSFDIFLAEDHHSQ